MNISTDTKPTNTPDLTRSILNKAIADVIAELYPPRTIYKADSTFTSISSFPRPVHRNTKLSLDLLTRFIITMDGGSISEELLKAKIPAKKSAFVQRRKNLDPYHFWYVLKAFNHYCNEMLEEPNTFKGYHIYAVDGTTVNIARDPDAPSFVKNNSAPNGYNQLHLTVIFDVLNKLYIDCFLQNQPQQDEIAALLSMFPWNANTARIPAQENGTSRRLMRCVSASCVSN